MISNGVACYTGIESRTATAVLFVVPDISPLDVSRLSVNEKREMIGCFTLLTCYSSVMNANATAHV